MERKKITHLLYVPFTGLGLYGGFRGNRWLRNRITVFKEYVVSSLLNQTSQNFTLWVSWRPEERFNKQVIELKSWLDQHFKTVFTYHGVCFWDDKYPEAIAYNRLIDSLHGSIGELIDYLEGDEILMTIQPSDDCYSKWSIESIQGFFEDNQEYTAGGFMHGYICNYATGEVSEYNPTTNPPFFTIKFPKAVFIEPHQHMKYTGPYKSHEFIPDFTKYAKWDDRGFLVGTHGENISTYYDHPFKGKQVDGVLEEFGIALSPRTNFKLGIKRYILRKLPHKIRRKVRYWVGERFYQKVYDFFRS